MVLQLQADSGTYFKVELNYSIVGRTPQYGWIQKSDVLGTYAANYNPTELHLYSRPNSSSSISSTVPDWIPQLYVVNACSGEWVHVSINYKGHNLEGWLSPDKQCANPYSTCN